MPGCAKATNPSGYTIEFDEDSHTYSTFIKELGRTTYKSATSVIHRFFPPFDPDGRITANKARKMGISVEQLQFQWKQKSAEACAMGTRVHETCEDVLTGPHDLLGNYTFRNQPKSDHERRLMAAGYNAAMRVKDTMNVIGIEQIVFDFTFGIAGTIDLLTRDKTDPDLYWILDWKTNEKIEFHNRWGTHGLDPISHLEDCSGTHYALQLSIYEWLLRIGKYIPHRAKVRRGIFHLTDDGPKFYELPDMAIEVRDMMMVIAYEPPF